MSNESRKKVQRQHSSTQVQALLETLYSCNIAQRKVTSYTHDALFNAALSNFQSLSKFEGIKNLFLGEKLY